jgi:single-strand DNA-binding protein
MFNQCSFIGNLTKDPVLRYTSAGKAVSGFTIAVNSMKKNEPALFLDCTVWERLAEAVAENLAKGSKVLVNGRLVSRDWEGDGGVKHNKKELQVRDMEFLDRKKQGDAAASNGSGGPGSGPQNPDDRGDVPF